jgi:hypothetical protein
MKGFEALEGMIEDGKSKLAEVAEAREDAWESIKDGVELAWDSTESAFSDAVDRFKK